MSIAVVILAAGLGVRMRSSLLKVLHPIGGTSILGRIISTVSQISPKKIIVVYGHQGEQLKKAFSEHPLVDFAEQKEPLGTGHAVLQALPKLSQLDVERVLILYGDVPLISLDTLNHLLSTTEKDEMGFITVELENSTGFGRVIRGTKGFVVGVREEKEATSLEKQIKETNAGFFIVPKKYLEKWLPAIAPQAQSNEICLPDILEKAVSEGVPIKTVSPKKVYEVLGVNDKIQLSELERLLQKEEAHKLMQAGVTLFDPARLDVRGAVTVGKDVVIDINVILEGKVVLGNNINIGPNVYLKDCVIQDNVQIFANSVIEEATVSAGCNIGPFARIRPGSQLAIGARIGNFVEIKNSIIGEDSKVNHLSYIGDASLGKEVNIGAGTITCNYDGIQKHRTIIGDNVSVGSDSQLIAPVTIGDNVTIGAGTTVVRDVPADHLIHNRIEHRSVADWSKDKAKRASTVKEETEEFR